MKKRLYKFIDLGDQDTRYEIFDAVEVLNEKELREKFLYMMENGIIPQKEIDDPYYANDKEFNDIDTIVDMINDICNYTLQYYIVQEIDVEI